MKYMKNIIKILCIALVSFSATSCLQDEPLINWENAIPVIELPYPSHNIRTSNVVPTEDETIHLIVNYSTSMASDNTADLSIGLMVDEDRLATYNATLSATTQKYVMLPADTYTLPATAVIAKGTKKWEHDMVVETKDLAPGEKYLLPIVISSVPEGFTLSRNFSYVYVRVDMKK